MQQMKSRLVRCKKSPIDAHPAEGSDAHAAVRVAAPGTSPMLELDDFSRSLLYKSLDRVLVRHKIRAEDCVLRVKVQIVEFAENGRSSPFSRNRVASHRIDFGDQGNRQLARHFCRRNRGTQTRSAAANNN